MADLYIHPHIPLCSVHRHASTMLHFRFLPYKEGQKLLELMLVISIFLGLLFILWFQIFVLLLYKCGLVKSATLLGYIKSLHHLRKIFLSVKIQTIFVKLFSFRGGVEGERAAHIRVGFESSHVPPSSQAEHVVWMWKSDTRRRHREWIQTGRKGTPSPFPLPLPIPPPLPSISLHLGFVFYPYTDVCNALYTRYFPLLCPFSVLLSTNSS